jgi:hypothetical protein
MTNSKKSEFRRILARLATAKPIGILAICASLLTMAFVANDAAQAAKFEAAQTQIHSTTMTPGSAFNTSQAVARIDHGSVSLAPFQVEPDPSLLHSAPTEYLAQNSLATAQ